jgi:hypothetical protein
MRKKERRKKERREVAEKQGCIERDRQERKERVKPWIWLPLERPRVKKAKRRRKVTTEKPSEKKR